MKNKLGVIILAAAITLISIYQLSFTFKSQSIEGDVEAYALERVEAAKKGGMENQDSLDLILRTSKRNYKDSIRDLEVYYLLGFDDLGYTYREVQKNNLKLGLDLQGGMQVTLIVSPDEMIRKKANRQSRIELNKVLDEAKAAQKNTQEKFTALFYKAYLNQGHEEGKLWQWFESKENEGEVIRDETTDEQILVLLDKLIDGAIDQAIIVLRGRVDRFGASNTKIQAIKSSGRIEVELPGVDDEKRIRKQLNSEAKLMFYEVESDPQAVQAAFGELYNTVTKNVKLDSDVEVNTENTGNPTASINLGDQEEEMVAPIENTEESIAEKDSNEDVSTSESSIIDTAKKESEEITIEEGAGESAASSPEEQLSQKKGEYFTQYFTLDQQSGRFFIINKNRSKALELLENDDLTKKLSSLGIILRAEAHKTQEGSKKRTEISEIYVLKKKAILDGNVVTDAGLSTDGTGNPGVSIVMNAQGTQKWAQISSQFVTDGRRTAIVLDGLVYSAPGFNAAITTGNSIITGSFTTEERKDLVSVLKAGRMPAPTDIERLVSVGPTLGKEAVTKGMFSLMIGLLLVIIFMVVYYGKGGFVADVALLVNLFFILGILSTPAIAASLTLPGIAGIVLTIGMSIDANVLIFERIREEIANGVDTVVAIRNGYKKAFWTIFDANITTFFAGLILFNFGSGLVQGFAVTMMIGIGCSFFSAVFITRLIIEQMVKKSKGQNLNFYTSMTKGLFQNLKFNFIGKRRLAYMVSGIVIVTGLAVIGANGLNMGVAFEGGYSQILKFNEDVNVTELESKLSEKFNEAGEGTASIEIKTYDGQDQVEVTTNFMIDSDAENADSVAFATIASAFPEAKVMGSTEVSATIADDIKSKAITALVLALIVIFLYIIVRFRKWQFGTGALFALFHDVLVVLSVFAIAGLLGFSFEIDEVFIGAMLTIVGYSINDTVVVFDRVREYLKIDGEKLPLATVLNNSLNSTLSRTLMTSITTLLVIVVLLFFGGEALRGFSFALLIGVLVGTYSSIFIATPVVLDASSAADKRKNKTVESPKEEVKA